MIFPLLILINPYIKIYSDRDSTLPALGYYVTWLMLLISGFFFSLGSLAFVRAFEEPPLKPLFTYKHINTDELLAAWLFLLGVAPFLPYSIVWIWYYPTNPLYYGYLVGSFVFVFCTYLFVLSCYPSDKV